MFSKLENKDNQKWAQTVAAMIGLIVMGVVGFEIILVWGSGVLPGVSKVYFPPDQAPSGTTAGVAADSWLSAYYMANLIGALMVAVGAAMILAGKKATTWAAIVVGGITAFFFAMSLLYAWFNYYAKANTPGVSSINPADDPLKCCVPEFYSNAEANGCFKHIVSRSVSYPLSGNSSTDNISGCVVSITRDQLGKDADFVRFMTALGVFFLGGVFIGGFGIFSVGANDKALSTIYDLLVAGSSKGKKKRVSKESESLLAGVEEEDDEEEDALDDEEKDDNDEEGDDLDEEEEEEMDDLETSPSKKDKRSHKVSSLLQQPIKAE